MFKWRAMRLGGFAVAGICATLMAAVAPSAQPGEKPADATKPQVQPTGPTKDELIAMIAAVGKPAEQHKVLESFVGEFRVSGTITMGPGMELSWESDAKGEMILGKRFAEIDMKSVEGSKPQVESKNLMGFDTRTFKYTMIGVDTLGTYSVTASGDYDEATRTMTLFGSTDELGRAKHFRFIYVLKDDGYTTEMQMEISAGNWQKVGFWTAVRKK